jgi:hypothetical protein
MAAGLAEHSPEMRAGYVARGLLYAVTGLQALGIVLGLTERRLSGT